jgi:aminoglycoside 6-adenylyltransferase
MDKTKPSMEQIEQRFTAWAQAQSDIRAAFVVGSRARTDHPADEWSDLDIIVITTKPQRYLTSSDWLKNIGDYWLTFLEPTPTGSGVERRVLFEGARDVDFAVFPHDRFRQAARFLPLLSRFPLLFRLLPKGMAQRIRQDVADAANVFGRGVRVLVDKEGLAAKLPQVLAEAPPYRPPTQREFLNAANDFWYHAVLTAKKLRRGELWWAKDCLDGYMKRLLLRMVEWQARATKGPDYDTWQLGRFLEEWAAPRALAGLRDAFAHYDENDTWRALLASMDLFRWLAIETAERLGHAYPTAADERVTEWVKTCLSERDNSTLPPDQTADAG